MKSWNFVALAASTLLSWASAASVAAPWGQCGGSSDSVCPEGFFCNTVNSYYSQCVKEGGASPPEYDSPGHQLFRRQSGFTPVTGAVSGGIVLRKKIQQLQSEDPDVFNMFLWSLYMMQRVSETEPLSYYQIAGIHGLPHIPWGEAPRDDHDPDYGYCTHGSALFATWHRPYLALVEQRITAHAVNEAGKFRGNQASRWQTAAARVRLPYWDWAQDDSAIPDILMRPTVTVTRPGANGGQPQQTNIPNPLYQYRFTNDGLRARHFDGLQAEAQITLRQPVNARTSDNDEADSEMRANFDARRSNTYNLFSIPNFSAFSSSAFQSGDSPSAWVSVESIHNQIHASIGGSNDPLSGHMSFVDYSSFDPIFWLHHANVDRLTAMYQAARPGARVTPQPATGVFGRRVQEGDMDNINTPLWPFRKASGSYFTSQDVSSASSIWDLGYAYPEVPSSYRGRPASELRTFVVGRINALYAPGSVNSRLKRAEFTTRREWICHFVFTPADVGGTAELAIYFNGTDGYAVGAGAALGKVRYTAMDKKMRITAAVPLTDALEREGIDVNDAKAVVGYLRSNIDWVMRKGKKNHYDLSKIPSLKVGVSSSLVTYRGSSELPVWSEFETYYEITEKKRCGMEYKDSDMVGSKDAKRYFGSTREERSDSR